MANYTGLEVAIVGMSLRFPGANDPQQFWDNLMQGKESIHFFTDEELEELSIGKELRTHPGFVNALGKVDHVGDFDAALFDFTHAEAEKLSPQTRMLLECAWQCLEDAGYGNIPEHNQIGSYFGANSQLFWETVARFTNQEINPFELQFLAEKDYISTLIAHKLNLGGPAISLQTACSTALVAVHQASRALLTGDCELALAGGVHLNLEVNGGYIYEAGMINSSDGHCRAFDAKADGTVGGNGAGVVALKLLKKAQTDRDHIYGILKGSAINNDGNRKISFSAPSVQGQREVIRKALKMARVSPESITFVEAHGTGTKLGDPVEMDALQQAYGEQTAKCTVGAVKSNLGHLGTAAGLAGLAKAALALKNKQLPGTLHYQAPNPELHLENSTFQITAQAQPLQASQPGQPLRGAVSSFGIGGTNAHAILEEAPQQPRQEQSTSPQLLVLSAHSAEALQAYRQHLLGYIEKNPQANPASLCYTYQAGRKAMKHRLFAQGETLSALAQQLQEAIPAEASQKSQTQAIIFTGSTSKALETLHDTLPAFRQALQQINAELTAAGQQAVYPGTAQNPAALAVVVYGLYKAYTSLCPAPQALAGYGVQGTLSAALAAGLCTPAALLSAQHTQDITATELIGLLKGRNAHTTTYLGSLHLWLNQGQSIDPDTSIPASEKANDTSQLSQLLRKHPGITLIKTGELQEMPEDASAQSLSLQAEDGGPSFLQILGTLWTKGLALDWQALHEQPPYKLALPTLPFQRKHYWLNHSWEDLMGALSSPVSNKLATPNWLHSRSWHRLRPQIRTSQEPTGHRVLVIGEHTELQASLAEHQYQCIYLKNSTESPENTEQEKYLAFAERQQFKQTLEQLQAQSWQPEIVLFAAGLSKNTGVEDYTALMHATAALAEVYPNAAMQLAVLTIGSWSITGDEAADPSKALLTGPLPVIRQEYQQIDALSIDIDRIDAQAIGLLGKALQSGSEQRELAIRGRHLWEAHFRGIVQQEEQQAKAAPGCYVITGGLGKLGLQIAAYLAAPQVKIYLLGRSVLDAADARQQQLEALRQQGAEVHYIPCDIANQVQARQVLTHIHAQEGGITGIIHGAAMLQGHVQAIASYDEAHARAQFLPKLQGAENIARFSQDHQPDFVLLMSSIASVLGGLGFASYAAANAVLDAFAQAKSETSATRWISVGWDAWYQPGMETAKAGKEIAAAAIKPEEGKDIFHALIAEQEGPLLVSTTPLQERLQKWVFRQQEEAQETTAEAQPTLHSRPELSTTYAAPETPLQQAIAQIWQQFFRLEKIGLEDDFYELGGDSLKGMALIKQYSELIGETVDVSVAMDAFTVRETAELLEMDFPEACDALGRTATGQKAMPAAETTARDEVHTEPQYHPLSAQQRRFYFLHLLEEDNIKYNLPRIIKIDEALSAAELSKRFSQLLQRHEALRTCFVVKDKVPMQCVIPLIEPQIEELPGQHSHEDIISGQVKPFKLDQAPLFRLVIFHTAEGKKYLFHDIHHIITDGTSKEVMEQELAMLLAGSALSPVEAQYSDYVAYQQSPAYQQTLDKQKAYWQEEFAHIPDPLALPLDFPRVAATQDAGKEVAFRLEPALTSALRAYCLESHSTSFVVLLAALKMTLAHLTGSRDIVIGTPVEGRMASQFAKTLGLFVNTLAIRSQPEPEMGMGEYIATVRNKVLQALNHQEVPFDDIVDHLGITRSLTRNPLFDIMFNLQSYKNVQVDKDVLDLNNGGGNARFDLNFRGIETAESIYFRLSYTADYFTEATVSRIASLYKNYLAQILQNPEQPIRTLRLDAGHTSELLALNPAPVALPEDSLASLFEQQVTEHGGKEALRHQKAHLTYAELDAYSRQLFTAHRLQQLSPQSHVAIILSPGIPLAAAIWAVIRAGHIFLPIDPETPLERIAYMLRDSGAALVLTGSDLAALAPDDEFVIEEVAPFGESSTETLPALPEVTQTKSLYTIYTSGTTGEPKGVTVTHRNVINYLQWLQEATGITAQEEVLLINNFAFDAVYTLFFGALLSGARLHLMDKADYLSPETVTTYIEEQKITYLKFTPSMGQLMLQAADFHHRLRGLRFLMIGGEAIRKNDLREIKEGLPGLKVMNHYGPTETTIGSAAIALQKDALSEYLNQPSVGRAIHNTALYILDERQQLVPWGAQGELYISGIGVAAGYLGKEALTARHFMPDPYTTGARMYRTGDLARWSHDGQLLLLGRTDDQVKISGHRIQLKEIEAALQKMDSVKQSHVLAHQKAPDQDPVLVAYIKSGAAITLPEIREHSKKHLPTYMIPAWFVPVQDFPVNKNGKLDTTKLPPYSEQALQDTSHYQAPETEEERRLHQLWAEVLERDKIGILDNFFEIGGNSMKLVALATRVNEAFGTTEVLTTFFQNPNIKQQAAYFASTGEARQESTEDIASSLQDMDDVLNTLNDL